MRARKFSLALSALAVVVALVATAGATRTAAVDDGDGNSPSLEGSWIGTATSVSPPNLPQIKDLITFTHDGNVIESRPPFVPGAPLGTEIGALLETAGHGDWVKTGSREYEVKFVFFIQRAPVADGGFIGTETIRMHLNYDSLGETLTGPLTSQIRNANGVIIFSADGTYRATRIRAQR